MKYRNMLPFVALSVLILTSCDDNKMEWYKDPTHGAVTSSELPLQLAEKISRYKPLKEYLSDPNFKLGIGVGMDEYLGDETTTTIVNENFNDQQYLARTTFLGFFCPRKQFLIRFHTTTVQVAPPSLLCLFGINCQYTNLRTEVLRNLVYQSGTADS